MGYPELLIDAGVKKSNDWSKYSWAKYVDGKLTYHFGKYFYSINLSNYGNEFDADGFWDGGLQQLDHFLNDKMNGHGLAFPAALAGEGQDLTDQVFGAGRGF